MEIFDLHGKVAIVTGGGRGNGKAICNGLSNAGAKVIAVDLGFDLAYSDDIIKITGDVTKQDVIDKTIQTALSESDKVIMVNNAGITIPSTGKYDLEDWNKTILVNLTAPFLWMECLRSIANRIRSCSIINITSLAAERSFPDNPAYIASKGGLKMLSRSYAHELSGFGFRVNNIGPGYIKTNMTQLSFNDPEKNFQRKKQTLLNRWGESDDLVGAVVFLASDASSYITGQDIYVDGGWLSKGLI